MYRKMYLKTLDKWYLIRYNISVPIWYAKKYSFRKEYKMHRSEFEPKREFLVSIRDDADRATHICIENDHPGHTFDTCPHREVFFKACTELEKLWDEYMSTPVEIRYA